MPSKAFSLSKSLQQRRDLDKYEKLIKTPANLVVPLILPANAELFVSYSLTTTVNTRFASINGQQVYCKPLPANTKANLGLQRRAEQVTIDPALTGVVKLWVRNSIGRYYLIAQKL